LYLSDTDHPHQKLNHQVTATKINSLITQGMGAMLCSFRTLNRLLKVDKAVQKKSKALRKIPLRASINHKEGKSVFGFIADMEIFEIRNRQGERDAHLLIVKDPSILEILY